MKKVFEFFEDVVFVSVVSYFALSIFIAVVWPLILFVILIL